MRKTQGQMLVNGDMSGKITSDHLHLDQDFGFAIQANYATTGTLGGTFTLEISVDYRADMAGNTLNEGNWITLANSSKTITAAGNYIWNYADAMYPFVRLVYTPAQSDSGTLNVFFQTRGF